MKIAGGNSEGCKFVVGPESTEVNLITEDQGIRAFFKTDGIVAEDLVEFCFQDLSKLKKSINLIASIEALDEVDLDFNGTFISYKGDVKFKLKTVKEDVVAQFVSTKLKSSLETIYTFNVTAESIKQVIQCFNIVNNQDAKVYLSLSDDGKKIIAEVDNKLEQYTNSVGIPISDEIEGTVSQGVCVLLKHFELFKVIPTSIIKVSYTDKKVLKIESTSETADCDISLVMISSIVKG